MAFGKRPIFGKRGADASSAGTPPSEARADLKTERGRLLDSEAMYETIARLTVGGKRGEGPAPDIETAASDLNALLRAEIADPNGIHLETLLACQGALAGFAVQIGLRESVVRSGRISEANAFVVVGTKSGQRFYYGDLINEGLFGSASSRASVIGIVAGEAKALGMTAMPDFAAVLRRIAGQVGGPDFGMPDVPREHLPHMHPEKLLDRYWNAVRNHVALSTLGPLEWPFLIAHSIRTTLRDGTKLCSLDVALTIAAESAIAMSHIDPARIHRALFPA